MGVMFLDVDQFIMCRMCFYVGWEHGRIIKTTCFLETPSGCPDTTRTAVSGGATTPPGKEKGTLGRSREKLVIFPTSDSVVCQNFCVTKPVL